MPTPFELLKVADLIKLAADTARNCSEFNSDIHAVRVRDIALRIKAAAEELEEVGRELDGQGTRRHN